MVKKLALGLVFALLVVEEVGEGLRDLLDIGVDGRNEEYGNEIEVDEDPGENEYENIDEYLIDNLFSEKREVVMEDEEVVLS